MNLTQSEPRVSAAGTKGAETADHKSFLKTIIAHPDQDGPRLVYSDWLEEHGSTEQERAQFIRLQCRYDAMARYSPERYDLEERAKQFLDPYADDWHDGVPTWARLDRENVSFGSRFRRGFLHTAVRPADKFFEDPGSLFAAAPICELELNEIRDRGKLLFDWAGARDLDSLKLSFCVTFISKNRNGATVPAKTAP